MLLHGLIQRVNDRLRRPAAAFAVVFLFFAPWARAQFACLAGAGVPPMIRSGANAEYLGDLILNCSGGGSAGFVNLELTLNVPFTSNVVNPATGETEALLLLNEPQPAPAVNSANGVTYIGQVKGQPGIPADAAGSGNVYQGFSSGVNSVTWTGVPVVPGSPLVFRITNVRASTAALTNCPPLIPCQVIGVLTATGTPEIAITNPQQVLAFASPGVTVTSQVMGDMAVVRFAEGFQSAMRKRTENTTQGPVSVARQNLTGVYTCTESGFTPDYATTNAGDVGIATTGTRLVTVFSNLPDGVTALTVANSVTSAGGQIALRRVNPPYGPGYAGGTFGSATGVFNLPVNTAQHKAVLLYEVMAMPPFAGVHGCVGIDQFTMGAHAVPSMALTGVRITGHLAPVDDTQEASGPAPEPRFAR